MKFRVHIAKLTKRNDDLVNTWVFDDPVFAATYSLKIRRVRNIGSNDALWHCDLSCQNKDPEDSFSRVDVLQIELVTGCDTGDKHSFSVQINGCLPRVLYKMQSRNSESWVFAASPQSYCEFDITRIHTLVSSIQ